MDIHKVTLSHAYPGLCNCHVDVAKSVLSHSDPPSPSKRLSLFDVFTFI